LKHSGASAEYLVDILWPIGNQYLSFKDSKPNIVRDPIHEMIESKPPEKTQNDRAQRTVEAEYNI
jgi:hypothetical protein